jgi:hypothetical protein
VFNFDEELGDGARAERMQVLDITLQPEPGEGVEIDHDGLSGPSRLHR